MARLKRTRSPPRSENQGFRRNYFNFFGNPLTPNSSKFEISPKFCEAFFNPVKFRQIFIKICSKTREIDSKFAKNDGSAFDDPFDLFEKDKTSKYERQSKIKKGKISEKAYKLLDFSSLSSKSDIRKKFKEVVKSLHPDTNGGDNSQEDLLKETLELLQKAE